ncbi:MAG: FAD-dependent oxidoreductase [Acidobacteriia bacterium]|nr:FAD-dependent oxidoreductase [Terriglobia bacterium]
MNNFRAKLLQREVVANETMAFHFERPANFEFKPGQYVDIILINPPEKDDEGISRSLSLASAPFEKDLMVATRLRDTAFKRVLRSMPVGSEVEIEGPYGSFTLHSNTSRAGVMIAGGIGITPFRSMLQQVAHAPLPHRLVLIYSNRRPEDAAFLEELENLSSRAPQIKFLGTMTAMDKSERPWGGARGYIDSTLISNAAKDLLSPIYYVVGPPAMVSAMHQTLQGMGIQDDDIRTEEFSGY